ncbi:MAG: hypothetical protein ACJ746_25120 [Bryobacteraceae bacterium]
MRRIPRADLSVRVAEWGRRLNLVGTAHHRAQDLYIGDHWSVARNLPEFARGFGFDVRLWICSAGYGFISPETNIKPYAATFAADSEDYVSCSGDRCEARQWWDGVCRLNPRGCKTGPQTIHDLCSVHSRTPLIIALSREYLDAVSDDVETALKWPYFREHLAIVSCGSSKDRSSLRGNLVPCDSSMATIVGGALTSLNVRIVRHLLSALNGEAISFVNISKAIVASRVPRRKLRTVKPRTNEEIIDFIRRNLATTQKSSASALLRRHRDAGYSCEQKRFSELYRIVCATGAA